MCIALTYILILTSLDTCAIIAVFASAKAFGAMAIGSKNTAKTNANEQYLEGLSNDRHGSE